MNTEALFLNNCVYNIEGKITDWLSAPFLHLVGFFIFVPHITATTRLLSGFVEFDFLGRIMFVPQTPGNQVLQLQNKFVKMNFQLLQETARDYLCQKLKTRSNLQDLFG